VVLAIDSDWRLGGGASWILDLDLRVPRENTAFFGQTSPPQKNGDAHGKALELLEPLEKTGAEARGRQKTLGLGKQVGDPRGGWVGQRPKKDQGQIFF
jgi:hypothetical protein